MGMAGQAKNIAFGMVLLWGFLGPQAACAEPAQPMPRHTAPVPLDAPSALIGNGLVRAKIYLPDAEKGFYRGTRFDQAGVIGSLTVAGQNFYGPWFDRVSPEVMDYMFTPEGIVGGPDSAISGPVEEFAPIGFEEAPPGGSFLKIGVGRLKKPDAKAYDHYRLYATVDAGLRSTLTAKDTVTFVQDVRGGYRYAKILRLLPGKPQLLIEHILTNQSGKTIATTVYDHNFLTLSPGNQDIVASFPFAIMPDARPDSALVRIDGHHFAYQRALAAKEGVSFHISGFGESKKDYDIHVGNAKTGAGMRVTADQKLTKINVWSIRSVMAVEPYIAIDLKPGATKQWTYVYTYNGAKP
jgi:hypothetical protein